MAVPDERAALEAWAKSEDMSIGSDCDGYIHSNTAAASLAWQARAALAATPAANSVELHQIKTAAPVVLPEPDAVLRVVVDGDTPSLISLNTLTNGEYGVFYASTLRALLATATGPFPRRRTRGVTALCWMPCSRPKRSAMLIPAELVDNDFRLVEAACGGYLGW